MVVTESGLGLTWSASEVTAPALHFLMTDYFGSRLHDARNNSAGILSVLIDSSQQMSGKFYREPVKFGRNPNGFNFVRESGKFPDPGQHKAREYFQRARTQFHRFVVSGKILRAARGDATRYVDPLSDMMADQMDDYLVDMARIMYSDGSGRIAEMTTTGLPAAETGTLTLRANQDVLTGHGSGASAATSAPNEPATHYIEAGGRYAIVSPTGSAIRGYFICNSVDSATTITATTTGISDSSNTFFNAMSIAAGDYIVKCSNDDALGTIENTAHRQEPVGLGGIFGVLGIFDGNGPGIEAGSTTPYEELALAYSYGGTDYFGTDQHWFQGLPANSAAASWTGDLVFNQAIVSQNGGTPRTPTESLFQRFYSTIRDTNNAAPDIIVSRSEVRDTYAETLLADKRYNDTLQLKGGWDPALVGPAGKPWVTDIRCQHNRAYLLSLQDGDWMQLVEEALGWATEQGANVWQYLQDDDLYQARMVESMNFVVGVRNRCGGLILDLLES